MIKQGPKLEMRQLILAQIVDIGTELAVMGLVASRAHSAIKAGNTIDTNRALYWLHARTLFVDGLFTDISRNSDAQARKLARQLVDNAELLPEVSSAHLEPQTEREFEWTSAMARSPSARESKKQPPTTTARPQPSKTLLAITWASACQMRHALALLFLVRVPSVKGNLFYWTFRRKSKSRHVL